MTSFLNGPAKGKSLMLHRSPLFLRVVEKAEEWDALDQVNDSPAAGETIHVYERTYKGGKAKSASGCYPLAHYRLHDNPPPIETQRDTALWRQWCIETPLSPIGEE